MLSSATRRLRPDWWLRLHRRVFVQLPQPYLDFLNLPVPEACVWGQLTDQEKTAVITVLARLMARAAAGNNQEPEHA